MERILQRLHARDGPGIETWDSTANFAAHPSSISAVGTLPFLQGKDAELHERGDSCGYILCLTENSRFRIAFNQHNI